MIAVNTPSTYSQHREGLRPVNLQTDLAPLADLIELSFAESMDSNGRAALREMRALSRMGRALGLLGRLNDLIVGISLGYVWVADGKLVGNVSIYPAHWPRELGSAWIIANVGVHPAYQRRGIARQLMDAALSLIAEKGGKHVILQVDYDNTPAIRLYEKLAFHKERAFRTWSRSALLQAPLRSEDDSFYITRPRSSDWQAEYALAQAARPNERGGVGWLKPTHPRMFRPGLRQQLRKLLSFNSCERLIVRSEDREHLLASLWIERGLTISRTRLTLLPAPTEGGTAAAEALLGNVLRRLRGTGLTMEHPYDDETTTQLLERLRFRPYRTVWHMRLEL